MANRVGVNINANDLTRSGLRSVRNSVRRMQRQLPNSHRIYVNLNDDATRAGIRRVQRAVRGLPDNVFVNVRLNEPSRADRNRIRNSINNAVRGPGRSLGGFFSGLLEDGIGQGIINGFKKGGPVGAAFLGTILTSLLAVIGASLAGLIITALGAAFVSVGGIAAAQSEEVKAKWSSVLETLKEQFRSVGEPMIPVLTRALDILEGMAEQAGPRLKEALENTVPATNAFIDGLADGFKEFGKNAFDRIMEAWNVFAPVFGEEWREFMSELGDAFGDMADLVRDHPTEIAMALEIVFETLELLVRAVTFFAELWVAELRVAGTAVGGLIQIMIGLLDVVLGAFQGILDGADAAFGWLPGVGSKIDNAKTALSGFRDDAVSKLQGIATAASNLGVNLDRANKKRKLEADISSFQHQLEKARADLKRTSDQKARSKLKGDISDLEAKLAAARRKLNALNGKTATTYVRTVQYGIGAEAANAARRAHGGVIGSRVGKAATGGVRNNLTMVGEQGPELVELPGGSRVRSNPDTRRIMSRSQAIRPQGSILIDAAGDDLSQLLLRILRLAIRNEGGGVEVLFPNGV